MFKGDIVLIPFPFTDLSGSKLRPAVILFEGNLDVTVCFITTQLTLQEPTDIAITPNNINGLKKLSLIRTSKLATVDKLLIKGVLGKLAETELNDLNINLKILFQIY